MLLINSKTSFVTEIGRIYKSTLRRLPDVSRVHSTSFGKWRPLVNIRRVYSTSFGQQRPPRLETSSAVSVLNCSYNRFIGVCRSATQHSDIYILLNDIQTSFWTFLFILQHIICWLLSLSIRCLLLYITCTSFVNESIHKLAKIRSMCENTQIFKIVFAVETCWPFHLNNLSR